MKYIITESKLKDIIKRELGIDLTGNIEMVTSKWDLPILFRRAIPLDHIDYLFNHWGPMYIFWVKKNRGFKSFLYQKHEEPQIINESGKDVTESWLIGELGLTRMGLSLDDIIDIYLTEDLNESISLHEEEKHTRYSIIRRTDEDWAHISDIVDEGTYMYDPCKWDGDSNSWVNLVVSNSALTYLLGYLDNWDSELFVNLQKYIERLIRQKLMDKIVEEWKWAKSEC